jgi:hypothetical protein
MLHDEANTGNGTPPLHLYIGVDVDVCISVAAKGHAVDNARCEIRFVNGKG